MQLQSKVTDEKRKRKRIGTTKKMIPKNNLKGRDPDIAFFFRPKDLTYYEVYYREGLPLICFVQASFELYAKALDRQDDALVMSGDQKE